MKFGMSPLCPYRLIGKVEILDLIPHLSGKEGEAWLEVVHRHFFSRKKDDLIINLSKAVDCDRKHLQELAHMMKKAPKRAFFSTDLARAKQFVSDYATSRTPLMTNEEEIVDFFGLDLRERHKEVAPVKERRRHKRFKVVLSCEVIARIHHPFITKAIVTNISEGGAFAQYLDLDASLQLAGLSENPHLPVELILKHPGSSECDLVKGTLIRVDLLGQQRGVAIQFLTPLESESDLVKRFKGLIE